MPEMYFPGSERQLAADKFSTDESLCGKSRDMAFGAYGQDGKAIITAPSFGCNQWKPSN